MTPSETPSATFVVATAPVPGAIAAVHLRGDIERTLASLGVKPVPLGAAALREIPGVDHAVFARVSSDDLVVTPHGGPAVVAALREALARAGARETPDDATAIFPEARSEIEALALLALSRAASPRAVPLLLDQPRRWRDWAAEPDTFDRLRPPALALNRLIDPPLVVVAGRPNIGKSTLLNTLAGRTVSIAASEPGVTRDHVGALLELDGLALRWIDAPGLREPTSDIEAESIRLARETLASADLVIAAADPTEPAPAPTELGVPESMTLRLGLRADLGPIADVEIAVSTRSASAGASIADLARLIRRRLVPDAALQWTGPWLFDERLPEAARRDVD